jgi:hypothetical protein
VALGDPSVQTLHQCGKLDEPGRSIGRRAIRTVSGLRAVIHKSQGTRGI